MKVLSTVIIVVFVGVLSCSEENIFEPTCTGLTPSFVTDVQPIISSNCAVSGCHTTGSTKGPGALTTYAQISGAKSSISIAIKNGSMPRNGSLTADEKNQVLCWILNGAPNN
jgi:hypothetical protein